VIPFGLIYFCDKAILVLGTVICALTIYWTQNNLKNKKQKENINLKSQAGKCETSTVKLPHFYHTKE
jgi:hypothetical protein